MFSYEAGQMSHSKAIKIKIDFSSKYYCYKVFAHKMQFFLIYQRYMSHKLSKYVQNIHNSFLYYII